MINHGVVSAVSEVMRTHFKVSAVLDDTIHILHALLFDEGGAKLARRGLPSFVMEMLKHARLRQAPGTKSLTLCNQILELEGRTGSSAC